VTDSSASQPNILDSGTAGAQTARGAALRIVAYGVSLLVSLATIPIVTHYLTPAQFVAYSVAASIAVIALGAVDAGLVNLGLREYAVRHGLDRTRLMQNLLGFRLLLGGLGIGLATAFAAGSDRSREIVVGAALMTSAGAITMAQQAFTIPLSAELRNGVVAFLDLLKNIVVAVGNVVLVVLAARLDWFFAVAVLGSLVLLAATVPFVSDRKTLKPTVDRAEWARIARTMLPYAAATAVAVAYFRVALVAMDFVASKTETSRFALSFRIIESVSIVPAIAAATALPVIARAAVIDRQRLGELAKIMHETAIAAGFALALIVAGFAPLAVRVLGAGKYPEAADVLRVQSCALGFTAAAASFSVVLLALGRFRAIIVNGVFAAGVALVLTLVLGSRVGAVGGGIATLAAEATVTAGYAAAVYRAGRDLGPDPGRPFRALAAALVTAAAIIAVTVTGFPYAGGVVALIYVPLVVLVGGVPPLAVQAIRKRSRAPGPP
jgi:O-antigen/teichoic acid export membrane protein